MESNNIISGKMEKIASIFQNARETASGEKDLDKLVKVLASVDPEFVSIAFEGASMEIAQQSFSSESTLEKWFLYLKAAEAHAAQIYIGLGWAIAAEKKTDLSCLADADQSMLFRMWDGAGYFDGKLRQRQVVKGLARMDYIPGYAFRSYDQGLGRSLWYSTKGDPLKTAEIISTFPPARQVDLWRGIGIACSYVGGCDETILKMIATLSADNKLQLGIGAAMVAKSRSQAASMTKDLEKACTFFANMSAGEAMEITVKSDDEAGNSFDRWLTLMERGIRKKEELANKQ
jgi:hypothetical protein